MSKMTREQALIECRDLWIKMRDGGAKCRQDKNKYLEPHQEDYKYACPCCEYVAQHLNTRSVKCVYCLLLHLWNTPEDHIPCLGVNSPYMPFEYNEGTPELADKIVQECQRLLDGGLEDE